MSSANQNEATSHATDVVDISEQRFLRAFRASPDWMVISGFPDGRLIEVNHSFERVSGYRAEEVIGKTTLEIGLWADERKREDWTRGIAEAGSAREIELRLRMRSGEVRNFRSTTNLAHNLGLTVVAEGVEDAATLEQLALCGCDEVQGFHVARPMAGNALSAWARSNGTWRCW